MAYGKYGLRTRKGFCGACGKRRPEPGFKRCAVCRAAERVAKAERTARRKADELCVVCGDPAARDEQGYAQVRCPYHRALHQKKQRQRIVRRRIEAMG